MAAPAPRGKGLYIRSPRHYPNDDPAGYARNLGCSFLSFHSSGTDDAHISRARGLGLQVYLHMLVDAFRPAKWERTLDELSARARRTFCAGIIADPETAAADDPAGWRFHDRGPLVQALATLARTTNLSVGITSFPEWYVNDLAPAAAAGCWGSPQIYGRVNPADPDDLFHKMDRWRKVFPQMLPSLGVWTPYWGPPGATTAEWAQYLAAFRQERGGLFWQVPSGSAGTEGQIFPQPGTPEYRLLHDWQVVGGGRSLVATLRRRVADPLGIGRSRA